MPADLPAIRARLAVATPGPWKDCGWHISTEISTVVTGCSWSGDADLIAHAPSDLTALCDEVEALRAEVERLRGVVSSKPRVCQDCRTTGNFHGSLTHCACGGRLG